MAVAKEFCQKVVIHVCDCRRSQAIVISYFEKLEQKLLYTKPACKRQIFKKLFLKNLFVFNFSTHLYVCLSTCLYV